MMKIKFKKLYPDSVAPVRSKKGDAGWDLVARSISEEVQGVFNFHTGIAVEIPAGHFGLLLPRSSMRKTCYSPASSGVIDSGYRGELILPLRVTGFGALYDQWDRVCQLIILPLPDVEFVEAEELGESDRGAGGFGSTGR